MTSSTPNFNIRYPSMNLPNPLSREKLASFITMESKIGLSLLRQLDSLNTTRNAPIQDNLY